MNPLIVAGFHRSGTSAIARSLHLAGLFLGDDLLGSEPSNPYGHFEDNEVISIHQEILELSGTDWKSREPFDTYVPGRIWDSMRQFVASRNARHESTGEPWGFKDPRVCLLLPIWLHLVPEAEILIVFRNPSECVRSLHMRHSRQLAAQRGPGLVHRDFWSITDLGVRMWINYHRVLLSSLPDQAHVHAVDFSDRAAVGGIVSTVNDRWDLGLDPAHETALDPSLGGSRVDPIRVIDATLIAEATSIWRQLQALASSSAELVASA
ncbi:MAG: hypothetical protein HKN94_05365 [Acidimicrobiales bacterium]|nr:hypothetical protein [Acidimicrobiales bacterium]RZV48615.1 MAG: hypothetical protein EX269_01195 [Acidimicrobiales bacterium]